MDIQNRLDLPDGEYTKTAPTKGKDKFRYMHIARKSNPVWDIKLCMMKIRAYCSRAPLSTRVEFGFSQDKVKLSDFQKDYLRGVFHQYAKLHGLMEYRRYSDKHFYNVYAEFEGDPEAVAEQTALFFSKLFKVSEGFIDAIHKGDEESKEKNDRR